MSINFSSFEIGRRALNANQLGINVTGQNIANVNTPGYSRQRVSLAEARPATYSRNAVGTGVTIEGVQAFRDRFIESRLQTETAVAGRLSAQRDALSPVEMTLKGSENGGLQASMQQFFGSFRDLEANPSSIPLRAVVAQRGANLATSFQTTRGKLDTIRRETDGNLRGAVEDVNTLAKQIADLNNRVGYAEATGANASALRDQRTELVKQISELSGARAVENEDGTVNVTIGEGRALVLAGEAKEIKAENTPPLGLATLTLDGEPAVITDGKIRGLQDAITATTGQIDRLDGLAASIVERVNTLHASGTDLNGNAGTNFFAVPANGLPVTAANIAVNAAISTDSRLDVASPLAQPGKSGTVAGAIADLLTDTNTTVGNRSGSFASIFGGMISEAGEGVRSAEVGLETQAAIIAQTTAQRDSISGVSIDEEAINLLQYQKAFEAAARFLKVADEMTQTILSLAQ